MKGNKKMKRKGFTLIELLVVIAIIGLLSTLSVVSLNSAREKARDANRKSDMNSISTALELYNVEEDHYLPTAGTCDDNILANSSARNLLCSTFKIDNNGNEILHAIPTPPIADDYIGFSAANEADATSYCISAKLESGNLATEGYFKCVNGSCYLDSSACTSNSN